MSNESIIIIHMKSKYWGLYKMKQVLDKVKEEVFLKVELYKEEVDESTKLQ